MSKFQFVEQIRTAADHQVGGCSGPVMLEQDVVISKSSMRAAQKAAQAHLYRVGPPFAHVSCRVFRYDTARDHALSPGPRTIVHRPQTWSLFIDHTLVLTVFLVHFHQL